MQKKWYAVYTKPECENKVTHMLSKKGIENFYPVNNIKVKLFKGSKNSQTPLFQCYVFLCINEKDFSEIEKLPHIRNFVYWEGRPAIIKTEEIELMKEFTRQYSNIKIEKTHVNIQDSPKITEVPYYANDGILLFIKRKSIKVNLPSLGFKMIVDIEGESFIDSKNKTALSSKFIQEHQS